MFFFNEKKISEIICLWRGRRASGLKNILVFQMSVAKRKTQQKKTRKNKKDDDKKNKDHPVSIIIILFKHNILEYCVVSFLGRKCAIISRESHSESLNHPAGGKSTVYIKL